MSSSTRNIDNTNNIETTNTEQTVYEEDEDRSPNNSDCALHVNPEIATRKSGKFILEPAVFLIYFAINLSSTVFQNQLLYQSCLVVFHHSKDECEPMLGKTKNNSQDLENEIQPYVSRIIMANSLISAIIPAVFSLFIGPWSDKFGRRPIILVTTVGIFLNYLVYAIMAAISVNSEFTPWLYLLAILPSSLCGGSCAFLIVVYAYVSDVSPPQFKVIKMVLNDAGVGLGLVVGNIVSGYLFDATNMATVFAISAVAVVLAFLYMFYYAEESVDVQEASIREKVMAFVSIDLLADLMRTCFKRRSNGQRAFIWTAMVALIITNFVSQGEGNVFYLFLRKKFDITVTDYSTFNAISNAVQIAGGIFVMILLRRMLHMSSLSLSAIALICCMLQSVVRAVAAYWWQIYLATVLGLMSGIVNPMLLAFLSHMSPTNEFGKIFALTNSLETIAPLAAAPIYTSVYNATLTFYPGLYNIISAALYVLCIILTSTLLGIQLRRGESIFNLNS